MYDDARFWSCTREVYVSCGTVCYKRGGKETYLQSVFFIKQQVFPWSCHVFFLHGVSCKSTSVTSQDYLGIDLHRNNRDKSATYEGTTATQSM